MSLLQTIIFPLVAMLAAFAVVIAVPRRSAATRLVQHLERKPDGGTAQALTERIVAERNIGKLHARFFAAGWYDAEPSTFLARCAGLGVAGVAMALVAGWLLHFGVLIVAGGALAFGLGFGHLPFSRLNGAVKRRGSEISRAMPDLLDSLASTIRAGLALNAALTHATGSVQGALADELRSTLAEIRLGRARADALRSLAARVQNEELALMVRATVQAERLGANLSTVFTGLAAEARERRVLKAEEIAASLPVKMVLPMAFLMLPALFVMIFGAVAADYFART
ncbi:MAG TPA: type II secretion system F family protein [Candidatus Elarobacter sp.]